MKNFVLNMDRNRKNLDPDFIWTPVNLREMPKTMQNVILFAEQFKEKWCTPLKIGDLFFNRFGVDEDAAFEMLGVYQLEKTSNKMIDPEEEEYKNFEQERKDKGKDK